MTASEIGDPPEWLLPPGKALWSQICDHLGDTLLAVDRGALIMTCSAFAAAENALKDLNERGTLVPGRGKHPDEDGEEQLVKNPANQIAREQGALFKSFIAEFGLSPAARKRLTLAAKSKSEGEELID